jgi:hypothetical protein
MGGNDGAYLMAGCDNCSGTYNPEQTDADLDGIGDICEGFCLNRVGNANGIGGDEPTIGDISILTDYLFIRGSSLGLAECL